MSASLFAQSQTGFTDYDFWYATGAQRALGVISEGYAGDFDGDDVDDVVLIADGAPFVVYPRHGSSEVVELPGTSIKYLSVVRHGTAGEGDTAYAIAGGDLIACRREAGGWTQVTLPGTWSQASMIRSAPHGNPSLATLLVCDLENDTFYWRAVFRSIPTMLMDQGSFTASYPGVRDVQILDWDGDGFAQEVLLRHNSGVCVLDSTGTPLAEVTGYQPYAATTIGPGQGAGERVVALVKNPLQASVAWLLILEAGQPIEGPIDLGIWSGMGSCSSGGWPNVDLLAADTDLDGVDELFLTGPGAVRILPGSASSPTYSPGSGFGELVSEFSCDFPVVVVTDIESEFAPDVDVVMVSPGASVDPTILFWKGDAVDSLESRPTLTYAWEYDPTSPPPNAPGNPNGGHAYDPGTSEPAGSASAPAAEPPVAPEGGLSGPCTVVGSEFEEPDPSVWPSWFPTVVNVESPIDPTAIDVYLRIDVTLQQQTDWQGGLGGAQLTPYDSICLPFETQILEQTLWFPWHGQSDTDVYYIEFYLATPLADGTFRRGPSSLHVLAPADIPFTYFNTVCLASDDSQLSFELDDWCQPGCALKPGGFVPLAHFPPEFVYEPVNP